MPVVTSAVIGAGLAGWAAGGIGVSTFAGALAVGATSMAIGGGLGYLAGNALKDMMAGPKAPKQRTPDPLPQQGSEGIRSGETSRIARKRSSVQLALTQGQNRNPTMLGGIKEQLG